ncbi:hypothetical protein [Bacillus sp. HMF5848]|uniref:hypothetical protein n=1 Tax=Bacillus sp. HMF5848 TaxID=2495421 RepID=UPI00163A1C7E|nr:hypothetical protein [Bacillus sp. HMF5848]
MVNTNFNKFREAQKRVDTHYLGEDKEQNRAKRKDDYNNQNDTDKAPGATGRTT